MKTTIETGQEVSKKYPYIGIHCMDLERPDPTLILFTSEDNGVYLAFNHPVPPHEQIGDEIIWNEDDFVLFTGKITLEN